MEAKAVAKGLRLSPIRARLVVDMIRGKKVQDALNILNKKMLLYSSITSVALLIASPLEVIVAIITMFVSSVPLGFVELGAAICGIGLSILVLPYVIRLIKYSKKMTKLSVFKIVELIKGGAKNEG